MASRLELQLVAFYQVFNPEKLQQPAELTKLAARFLADQTPLNTALHKKYGCDLNSGNMFHTAVHSAMELLEQGVVTKSEYQKLVQQAAALSKRNLRARKATWPPGRCWRGS
jgi:hypothetical protein